MSARYHGVHWNRQKKVYDRTIGLVVIVGVTVFALATAALRPELTAETILLRTTSISALCLLHLALAIGPLARLDRRFLPLLYNRRHLGVTIFLLALVHAALATVQFHALGDTNPLVSIFTAYGSEYAAISDLARVSHFPFEPLGALALAILFIMAATSHDFWLRNLGASTWKLIHTGVYVAYGAAVLHVAFGVLQSERSPVPAALLGAGFLGLVGLHIAAGRREARLDRAPEALGEEGYVRACAIADLRAGEGRVCVAGGERVAVFRDGDRVYALANACRHQGGPIGEGRIVDGCVTCPWHGWQYLPGTGRSPPPFEEEIATFPVRIVGDDVHVLPRPNPPGTVAPGARIGEARP